MSEAKHTPGPWRIMNGPPTKTRGIDVLSESYNGKIVASCWFSRLAVYKGEPEAQARADAALIAAAPELLDMLKQARECIAYCRKNHPDIQKGDGIPIEALIDATIAKAVTAGDR